VVHGYWSIDLVILHTTANDLLLDFVRQLATVLDELSTEARIGSEQRCVRSSSRWASSRARHRSRRPTQEPTALLK
jgi:hypothetical protein